MSTPLLKNAPVYERIYQLVSQVPAGQVVTYGQIAAMVGRCTPRMVGYAMAALTASRGVPWQRVVNRQGQVSLRGSGNGSARQRELLEAEGITFDEQERIDFEQFGWSGPDWEWLEENGFYPLPPLRNK